MSGGFENIVGRSRRLEVLGDLGTSHFTWRPRFLPRGEGPGARETPRVLQSLITPWHLRCD